MNDLTLVIDNHESLLDYLIQNETNLLISINQPYLNTTRYPDATWKDINPIDYNHVFQFKEVTLKINNHDRFSFKYASITNLSLNDALTKSKISSFLLDIFSMKNNIQDRIIVLCE